MYINNQEIAIAKICGWKWMPDPSIIRPNKFEHWCPYPDHEEEFMRGFREKLPRYCEVLDDIHTAIKQEIIGQSNIIEYRSNEDLFQEQLDLISEREQVPVWHFSARLYAEAFLKTFGKWENTNDN